MQRCTLHSPASSIFPPTHPSIHLLNQSLMARCDLQNSMSSINLVKLSMVCQNSPMRRMVLGRPLAHYFPASETHIPLALYRTAAQTLAFPNLPLMVFAHLYSSHRRQSASEGELFFRKSGRQHPSLASNGRVGEPSQSMADRELRQHQLPDL